MEKFDCTYKYKLIYVFSMPYDTHKGLLKIGEATLTTDTKPEFLTPNCRELNQAAIARIKGYTATASVNFKLEHTELAVLQKDGYTFTFKDKDVHMFGLMTIKDGQYQSGKRSISKNGRGSIFMMQTYYLLGSIRNLQYAHGYWNSLGKQGTLIF